MRTTFWSLLTAALLLPACFDRAEAATFTVTTTNHSDAGSLRQAILDANANPGADQIAFNIVSAGKTISPTNALPAITEAVTIDGTTQPGFANAPIIELNGQSAGTGADGLRLWSGGIVIRGLVINRFNGDGIEIATNGNNTIEGCIIGLNVGGTTDQGNNVSGIFITNSPNNRIGGTNAAQRNVISGNQQNGVLIQGLGASANNILGNVIGLNATGGVTIANSANGIFLNGAPANVVGGAAGNVISGNSQSGIRLEGTNANSNLIAGNTIGLNPTGLVDLGNGQQGVFLVNAPTNTVGGTTASARNVISGNNQAGVRFDSASARGNRILGNFIGTDTSGEIARGNSAEGVGAANNASFNSIGGVNAGEANLIAFNSGDGVFLPSGTNNAARGNAIHSNNGLGIDLGADGRLNNDAGDPDTGANLQQNHPVLVRATNTPAGLFVSGTLNSRPSASYLLDFYSNVLPDFSTNGEGQVYLGSTSVTTGADSNAVFAVTLAPAVGRWISATASDTNGNTSEFSTSVRAESTVAAQTFTVVNTNDSGPGSLRQALTQINNTSAVASHRVHFAIPGSGTRTITLLSDLPGIIEPVIIDGFTQAGSSSNTLATGNNAVWLIRLDGNNSGAVSDGLRLLSSSNVVRGLIITRFLGNGIELAITSSSTSAGNVIVGNCIGLDENGADQGNSANGVFAGDSPGNRIGGAAPGDRNVLSGNGGNGVEMNGPGAFQNRVLGNYIGSDPGGTLDRRNNAGGVFISSAAHNTIGGAAAGEGNLLVYNLSDGVEINGLNATNNLVLGNFIGTDASGASLGNVVAGVFITGNARFNVIGGITSGAGNRIAYNFGDGIYVQSGTNNAIRGNTIWNHGVMGIDLGNNGVTANDAGDSDTGANQQQNFPVITSGTINPASTVIAGTLNSRPNGNYTLDFFANLLCDDSGNGEGQQYLGSTSVTTDGSGNAAFNVTLPVTAVGRFLTATATDTNGNSSEFSACFSAASTLPPMTFTVVNTNDAGAGSLRQALLDADSFPSGSPNIIAFNIPGAGPHTIAPLTQLPTNREPVFINGYSQPGANTNLLVDGFNGAIRIRIDGARLVAFGTVGLRLQSGGNVVRGIAFTTWGNRNAIEVSRGGSNVIAGCLIGIDPDGSDKHAGIGVLVTDSAGNQIGGLSPRDRNIISYNFSHAIQIQGQGASNNVVQGNFIGTDFTGTIKRANAIDGVRIDDGSYNLIGGTAAGARNLISGNSDGVAISSPTPGAARGNVVQGNLIGTDITGTVALGNASDGIVSGGFGTMIGGPMSSARNIIGGSGQSGIDLSTGPGGAVVLGNWIGIGNGGNPLTNGAQGINVSSSSNRIGGTFPGDGNVIAYSRNHGVAVTEFSANVANAIRGNSIYANHSTFQPALGIDLGFNGITANDAGDGDSGANNRQNFPVITSASGTASSTTVAGTLNSLVSQTFQVDFFANTTCDPSGNGEGQFYLGNASVNTDGSGNGSFNVTLPVGAQGRFITATATDAQGNSSEFSACFEASVGIAPMTFTVVNTNDSGAGSLRQAILDSNGHVSSQNNTIAFNVPGAGIRGIKLLSPLPLFTQPVTVDGFTQPGSSANTLPNGNNANWLIELRGVGAQFSEETLRLNISGLVVRGLRLTASAGLAIEFVSSNCVVAGCSLSNNSAGGITINAAHGNRVGGPAVADANVISAGGGRGVEILGGNNNTVAGNTINGFDGVSIFNGSANVVNGNVIAFCSNRGISIQSGTNNALRANRMFSNAFPIDLGSDNVTANDAGDADSGPNHLQNFPILTNAIANASNTVIQGRLNSRANTTYTIEFFANTVCHFSGNGEGEFFLGSASVTTDGSGNATFNAVLPVTATREFITATATDPAGNTSEFSPCQRATVNIPGQIFTVVNANDGGPGSLRQALIDSGLAPSSTPDQIVFNIPGPGVKTIFLLSPLPAPMDAVIIDGYTQAGSTVNTSSNANNAVLRIQLSGSALPFGASGLMFTNSGNTVRGLSVTGFDGAGILLASPGNVVEGCWIGAAPSGLSAGNTSAGVSVNGPGNRIGGTSLAARNIVVGSGDYGIAILGANASSNVVQGNFIGVGPSGANAPGNQRDGVFIFAGHGNLIGGTNAGAGNVIGGSENHGVRISNGATGNRVEGNFIGVSPDRLAPLGNGAGGVIITGASTNTVGGRVDEAGNVIRHNDGHGVSVSFGTQNAILSNEILFNTGDDIQIAPGANDNVQPPVLDFAARGSTIVKGGIRAQPNTTYEVTVMADIQPYMAPSHARRQVRVDSFTVTTDANGNAPFNTTLPRNLPDAGRGDVDIFANVTCQNSSSENSTAVPLLNSTNVNLQVKTHVTDPVLPGSNAVLTISVTNKGPANATAVKAQTAVPPANQVVSTSNPGGSTTVANGLVDLLLGPLNVDQGKQVSVTYRPGLSGLFQGVVLVDSIVEREGDPSDNHSTFLFYQVPGTNAADLSVGVATAGTVQSGVPHNVVVNVINIGRAAATGVEVVVDLPVGSEVRSRSPSQGTASQEGSSRLVWTLGALPNGGAAAMTINLLSHYRPPNRIVQTLEDVYQFVHARVTATSPDPNLPNNLSAGSFTVNPPRLQAAVDPGAPSLTLSYPTGVLNSALEFTTNLTPPIVWQPWTGERSVSNGFYIINVTTVQPQLFFQLNITSPPIVLPELTFRQVNQNLDGFPHPFSDWGQVELSFTGRTEILYFNLDVDSRRVIQNVPVTSLEGTGATQKIHFNFPIGDYGTPIFNINYAYSLTTNPFFGPISVSNSAPVLVLDTSQGRAIATEPLTYVVPHPLVGEFVFISAEMRAGFPNREAETNQCLPSALHNSLTYLNTNFNLNLDPVLLDIETINRLTGYQHNVGIVRPRGKTWVEHVKEGFDALAYPLNTEETRSVGVAMAGVRLGYDVEVEYCGHIACVLGIDDLGDGRYAIHVAHDLRQGQAGGLVNETWIHDTNLNLVFGNSWSHTFKRFLIQYPK